MRLPWIIASVTVVMSLSATSFAQTEDNPYGEPAAPPPAAQPAAAKPPAARPPAAKPPAPPSQPREVPAPVHADPPPPPPVAHVDQPDPRKVEIPSHREPTAEHGVMHHVAPGKDKHGALGHDDHATGHDAQGHDAHDAHGHGGPGEMNWFYGFLGKDAEAEPSLLWRKPDMPPPFLANLINFALFAYVVVRFGRKPLQEALKNRKQTIMKEIDAATKMRNDASERLEKYEDKLKHIDDEMERIRDDFRAQGEREKERILAEAREKKERMLKDAQFMIEQEVKQMRNVLMRDTVEAAIKAAETLLESKVSAADHDRISEDYVKQLSSSGLTITKGGSA
jgi:F-type H+-transporting ATPase subunit b